MHEIANYGVVHTVFILILLISRKSRATHENILIGWFFFLSLPLLSRIFEQDIFDIPIHFFQLHLMYPITFGPFLWLYIKSLTDVSKQFDKRDFCHFLPFLIISFYQISFDKTFNALESLEVDYVSVFDYFIMALNIVSMTYYSGISVVRLNKHSKIILDHFSVLPLQITLRWLYWITAWFIFTYLISSMSSLFSLHAFLLSPSYTLTLFVFILSFFTLKQTSIFNEVNDESLSNSAGSAGNDQQVDKNEDRQKATGSLQIDQLSSGAILLDSVNKTKYERSGLTIEKSSMYLQKLEEYMQLEKPYLDANLTIEKLAKQIAIPRHYLTQIISEQLNKNFYLFINEYRIDTVKQHIDNAEKHQLTMLDIAYKSGFNSKSTFNVVFKKLTEMTPSQYKKQKY